jgi:hypothetical protein
LKATKKAPTPSQTLSVLEKKNGDDVYSSIYDQVDKKDGKWEFSKHLHGPHHSMSVVCEAVLPFVEVRGKKKHFTRIETSSRGGDPLSCWQAYFLKRGCWL